MERVAVKRRLFRADAERSDLFIIQDGLIYPPRIKPLADKFDRLPQLGNDNNLHRFWKK
jgi:hypothetical protein